MNTDHEHSAAIEQTVGMRSVSNIAVEQLVTGSGCTRRIVTKCFQC